MIIHLFKKTSKLRSIIIILLASLSMYSQEKFTISGYVQDNESGENLIGVSIYDQKDFKGTASNQYGFYSLTMNKGNYVIVYSFIGYKSITKKRLENCQEIQHFKIYLYLRKYFDF